MRVRCNEMELESYNYQRYATSGGHKSGDGANDNHRISKIHLLLLVLQCPAATTCIPNDWHRFSLNVSTVLVRAAPSPTSPVPGKSNAFREDICTLDMFS